MKRINIIRAVFWWWIEAKNLSSPHWGLGQEAVSAFWSILWTEKLGMAQDLYAAQLEFPVFSFLLATTVHVLISLCLTTLPISLPVIFEVFISAWKECDRAKVLTLTLYVVLWSHTDPASNPSSSASVPRPCTALSPRTSFSFTGTWGHTAYLIGLLQGLNEIMKSCGWFAEQSVINANYCCVCCWYCYWRSYQRIWFSVRLVLWKES